MHHAIGVVCACQLAQLLEADVDATMRFGMPVRTLGHASHMRQARFPLATRRENVFGRNSLLASPSDLDTFRVSPVLHLVAMDSSEPVTKYLMIEPEEEPKLFIKGPSTNLPSRMSLITYDCDFVITQMPRVSSLFYHLYIPETIRYHAHRTYLKPRNSVLWRIT